jgi:hypothetical protein
MATEPSVSDTQRLANTLLIPIQSDINTQINTLKARSPPPEDIINKYNELNKRAEDLKKNTTDDYITISSKISALQSDLTALNIQTKRVIRKGGAGIVGEIIEETKSINIELFVLTTTLVGMLFGGIIASNWYIGKIKATPPVGRSSLLPQIKVIFYFVYGAVLFPLPLLYGALFDTPSWRAIFIPLMEVPAGLYNPLFSYRPTMNAATNMLGKSVLRLSCYILLGCFAFMLYLINFNN